MKKSVLLVLLSLQVFLLITAFSSADGASTGIGPQPPAAQTRSKSRVRTGFLSMISGKDRPSDDGASREIVLSAAQEDDVESLNEKPSDCRGRPGCNSAISGIGPSSTPPPTTPPPSTTPPPPSTRPPPGS